MGTLLANCIELQHFASCLRGFDTCATVSCCDGTFCSLSSSADLLLRYNVAPSDFAWAASYPYTCRLTSSRDFGSIFWLVVAGVAVDVCLLITIESDSNLIRVSCKCEALLAISCHRSETQMVEYDYTNEQSTVLRSHRRIWSSSHPI